MTPEQIEELKKLCAEATPGPWSEELGDGYFCIISEPETNEHSVSVVLELSEAGLSFRDMVFITAARTAVPELIAEVEKLQRQLRVAVNFINEEQQDQISFIKEKILDFFKGDQARAELWWHTPNYMLGDLSPQDMIPLGYTGKLVQFVLSSLEENEEPK